MINITANFQWNVDGNIEYNSIGGYFSTVGIGWYPGYYYGDLPFQAESIASYFEYSGESLIGRTLSIHNTNIGVIVFHTDSFSSELADVTYVETINGVASVGLNREVYGIGVFILSGYIAEEKSEWDDSVFISGIFASDSNSWTNFRNTVEVTA